MGRTNYRSFSDRAEIAAFAEEQVEWVDLLTLAEQRLQANQVAWLRSAAALTSTNTLSDNDNTKVG